MTIAINRDCGFEPGMQVVALYTWYIAYLIILRKTLSCICISIITLRDLVLPLFCNAHIERDLMLPLSDTDQIKRDLLLPLNDDNQRSSSDKAYIFPS